MNITTNHRRVVPIALLIVIAALVGCSAESDSNDFLVDSVTIQTGTFKMAKGTTTTLAAVVSTTDGETVTDAAVEWTSSDPAIISIDATGKATAVSRGKATVAASIQERSATRQLEVIDLTGEWSATVADPAAPNGTNILTYDIEQNGVSVSGTYMNLTGFPPITDVNVGSVTGRIQITGLSVRFEQTIRVSASPCNIAWANNMRPMQAADGSWSLKPEQDRVALTSDNCTLNSSIRVAEVRLKG